MSEAFIRHVMLDLETLGTTPGCTILSIGAVLFAPGGSWIGPKFYTNVDRASCRAIGLVEDPATVQWWSRQSREAREALEADPKPIGEALTLFADFYREANAQRIWGHGASFDEPIIAAAFRLLGRRTPWKYTESRDTRTIYDLTGVEVDRSKGVHHNAVVDAENQAVAVCRAYARLGSVSTPRA